MAQFEIIVVGVIVFFLLFCLFALLFIPICDIAVPACIRKNAIIRRFFAWDCLETNEVKFDQTALQKYLAHKNNNNGQ